MLIHAIISSANSDTLTSFFPICIPLIIICCLIALARTLSTKLNRHRETGQPCLVPDFCSIISRFSPFILMWANGFLYIALTVFMYAH
jgi:glycerol uptake facilitator-like aquaporin